MELPKLKTQKTHITHLPTSPKFESWCSIPSNSDTNLQKPADPTLCITHLLIPPRIQSCSSIPSNSDIVLQKPADPTLCITHPPIPPKIESCSSITSNSDTNLQKPADLTLCGSSHKEPMCAAAVMCSESEEIAILRQTQMDDCPGRGSNDTLNLSKCCDPENFSLSRSERGLGLGLGFSPEEPGKINGEEPTSSPGVDLMTWWSLFARTASAGLYLFDFVSNILVAKQYYDLDYRPENNTEFPQGRIQGAFAIFILIVVVAHIANAIAFKLALPKELQPIRSAYFLPLIQLQRLITGIWKAGSCRDHSSTTTHELQEAEALYAIMGAAIESAPQLALQYMIFVQVGSLYTYNSSKACTPSRDRWCVVGGNISVKSWSPSIIIQLSLISSLMSGAYNGGRAIMYQAAIAGCKSTLMLCLIGGVYTGATLLLRCTTIATLVFIGNSKAIIHVDGDSTNTGPTDLRFMAFLIVGFVVPSILFWIFLRPIRVGMIGRSYALYFGARIMQSLIFAYVSLFLGPLYHILSDARARNKLKDPKFYLQLLFMMMLHTLLDVSAIIISTTSKSVKPCGPTLDGFRYIGNAPPLSATLTCTRFLTFVINGVTWSTFSMLSFVFLLHKNVKQSIF